MRQVTTRTPAVRRGKPVLTEMYVASSVNDIVVWHAQEILPESELITISLEKRWVFRELVVLGARSFVLIT